MSAYEGTVGQCGQLFSCNVAFCPTGNILNHGTVAEFAGFEEHFCFTFLPFQYFCLYHLGYGKIK